MTALENNLADILAEKQYKIIPENIKDGITIFGVTGTYAGDIAETIEEE